MNARSSPMTPYAAIGGVDGGVCEQFQFTWPSQVDDFKAQLNTVVEDTDASVRACPALPPDERASWERFRAEWKAFASRKTPTFGSSNEREQACAFARRLDGIRAKLSKMNCQIVGPEEIGGMTTGALDLVRWGVIGACVLGGVVVLALYAPEVKMAIRSLGGGKK